MFSEKGYQVTTVRDIARMVITPTLPGPVDHTMGTDRCAAPWIASKVA
jgi:hypothetical protein